ncbi:MAG: D-alanyl-D-alanine carboxypeptidase [Bacteroidetes bacterium]|nr:D-alanyl-D-alanine carboxypeptidase [Bacteroidota bacterium]
MIRRIQTYSLATLLVALLAGCSTSGNLYQSDSLETLFPESFTGFILMDPESGKILEEYNSERYFTPASNIKLLTFYTALQLLEDPLPVFDVYEFGFYYYLRGAGFPLFAFPDAQWAEPAMARSLLALDSDTIYICLDNMSDTPYGPGWAWDDRFYGFQTERTPISIYRNCLTLTRETPISQMRLFPPAFEVQRSATVNTIYRDPEKNLFLLPPSIDTISELNLQIPFKADGESLAQLLQQRIGKPIRAKETLPLSALKQSTLYSAVSVDSLYRRMLQDSDNHLAEQLLLLSSRKLGNQLSVEKTIQYSLENYLYFLPQPPHWVDGSGLSRYNLVTPRSMAVLLQKIWQEVEEDRLLDLFPAGGESGTIKDWYEGDFEPYVFAKTGTLRNHHCLSGYIRTKKGKLLVFSFMHDNFPGPSSSVKKPMEKVLRDIYERN